MKRLAFALSMVLTAFSVQAGERVDTNLQAKITATLATIQSWAANPALADAVKQANTTEVATVIHMNQAWWRDLPITDPFVHELSCNAAAKWLKSNKTAVVSEAFVSASNGTKVAFLSKTTYWSHLGRPKHDLPMQGKIWQGKIEMDESTGVQQIQVAVPIKDTNHIIGSLVVGLNVPLMRE